MPWLGAVLAAAVVLMAACYGFTAISVAAVGPPPLLVNSCPPLIGTSGDPGVPTFPTAPGADARLVPDKAPKAGLLCQYPLSAENGSLPGALAGRGSRLKGDLAAVPRTLAGLPRGTRAASDCRTAGTFAAGYLLLLTYPDGSGVWVATRVQPGECGLTTNGRFTTGAAVGDLFSRAQQTGEWPAG